MYITLSPYKYDGYIIIYVHLFYTNVTYITGNCQHVIVYICKVTVTELSICYSFYTNLSCLIASCQDVIVYIYKVTTLKIVKML